MEMNLWSIPDGTDFSKNCLPGKLKSLALVLTHLKTCLCKFSF